MPDFAMCDGKNCPIKDSCRRFTSVPNPYRQSYMTAPYDPAKKECEFFMSALTQRARYGLPMGADDGKAD